MNTLKPLNYAPILVAVLMLLISACSAIPSVDKRRLSANILVEEKAWQGGVIPAQPFLLQAFYPKVITPSTTLTVYIEGDGLAWLNRTTPSMNPTPMSFLTLKLALQQPVGNVAYLARPCQFITTSICEPHYWTSRRFSQEVIDATNHALDFLKSTFNAQQLQLVGYSGGGAVAALVAASRDDVSLLLTVAGNLDTEAWTTLQGISPLKGSLNPADKTNQLLAIKQIHLSGQMDAVVPVSIAQSFAKKSPLSSDLTLRTFENYNHSCCWVDNWVEIWNDSL